MERISANRFALFFREYVLIAGVLITISATAWAQKTTDQNWQQFRGPNGSGVYETTKLPKLVGPDVNVVWKRPIPSGYSSPVLSEKYLFLTAVEDGKLLTFCINRLTGERIWWVNGLSFEMKLTPAIGEGRI